MLNIDHRIDLWINRRVSPLYFFYPFSVSRRVFYGTETEVAQRSVARSLTVVLRRHGEISLKWPSRGSATRPTSPTNISKKRCSVLEFGLAQAAWKGPKRERRERVRENQWRLASASGSADGCITESFLLLVPLLLSAGQPHRRSERGRCVWARLSLTSLRRAPAGSGEGRNVRP